MGRRWVQVAVGVLVVAVAYIWVLPQFADYNQVWPALANISRGAIAVLVVVSIANLMAPAASQAAALPGLGLARAAQSDWATTAVTNTIPGGSAIAVGLTWAMYRSWQLESGPIGRAVVATGVWDNLIKLATPSVALLWLATERQVDAVFLEAAILGAVLLVAAVLLGAAVLGSEATARSLGRQFDRLPRIGNGWADRAAGLRQDTIELLRTRGLMLTIWTAAGHCNLYLLLLVCLRVVGIDSTALSAAAILAGFAFGRLATAIPLTPGGIGVMEASLTATLGLAGDAAGNKVVAGVLLFRFLTYLIPIPLGLLSWIGWSGRTAS